MFLIKTILICLTLIISACSGNKGQDNFDFSEINIRPKPKNSKISTVKETTNSLKIKSHLISLDKKDEIFKSIKYGKKDPFTSSGAIDSNLLLNLTLKGLISTSNENYALVNYLGKEGTITKNSIGGINTKFLPVGAKVKNFNFSDSEITILFDDKEFIISVDKIK